MKRQLAAMLLAASCSVQADAVIRGVWLPSSPDLWERAARVPDLRLKNDTGALTHIPTPALAALVDVARNISNASGVAAQIGLVDADAVTAAAMVKDGKPTVFVTLAWLKRFGADRDAMAVVYGHELAHLKLGHRGRQYYNGGALAALLNAATDSTARAEERSADEQGLAWASAAGYDPCGLIRASSGAAVDGPHPSAGERAKLANRLKTTITGSACP